MNVNLRELYKVKFYQIEMMRVRGYLLPSHEEYILTASPLESLQAFDAKYKNQSLSQDYRHRVSDATVNVIYYHVKNKGDKEATKILKEGTREIVDIINGQSHNHVILISRVDFGSQNLPDITSLSTYRLEHFVYSELYYNPLKHYRQPNCELLDHEETAKFLAKLKKDNKSIQPICLDDPVAKFLGGQIGQIITMQRKHFHKSVLDEGFTERIVVEDSIYYDQKKQ